jgi:hypothetical protein
MMFVLPCLGYGLQQYMDTGRKVTVWIAACAG